MNNYIKINSRLGKFHLNVQLKLVNGINCLFGPSGSGKTSIINCIAGLIKPEYAKITINNFILNNTEENFFCPIHKRKIGYVFQDSRLFPHMTVMKNLIYGDKLYKGQRKIFHEKEIIDLLNLNELVDRFSHNLSGGEKQRVAIGRALLSQPRLIIMDEPLASLDQEKKNELLKYIIKIYENFKIPIIYVSHSTTETFLIGHKINFISNGKLAFQGEKEKAFKYYNKEYNENLTDNFLQGKITNIKNNNITTIKINKFNIYVVAKNFKVGEQVLVKIKSTDMVICKSLLKGTSALNYLKLQLREINVGEISVSLHFQFNNTLLKANITKASLDNLKLKVNKYYIILIKAVNINEVMSFNLI